MVFVGGFMQILVACFNVLRNNLYGATAFFGFGSFWFANGLSLILNLYFVSPESEASYLLDNSDPWGVFFRSLFVFCFTGALLKQTLVMSRLSTILIFLLLLKVGAQAFTGWSVVFQWIQLVVGTLTSVFAFYVFLVDFTNGVYHREVFNPHKWSSEHSPEEVFGAAGRSGTLFSKAARLRQAQFPDVPRVRAAMDEGERQLLSQRLVTPSHKRTVSLPGTRNADETSQPAVNTLAE
jgi:succinate-acetate transporter protein